MPVKSLHPFHMISSKILMHSPWWMVVPCNILPFCTSRLCQCNVLSTQRHACLWRRSFQDSKAYVFPKPLWHSIEYCLVNSDPYVGSSNIHMYITPWLVYLSRSIHVWVPVGRQPPLGILEKKRNKIITFRSGPNQHCPKRSSHHFV